MGIFEWLFEEEKKINNAVYVTKNALNLVSKGADGKLYRPTYYLKLSSLYLKLKQPDSATYFAKRGLKNNTD